MNSIPRLASYLLALGLLSPASGAQGAAPPTPVRVDPVRSEELQDLRGVSGEVRAVQRSLVATREAGLVREVLVREGQRVEKGAVLARLDHTHLDREAALLDARKDLAAAVLAEREAALDQARRDRDALVALAERDAVSPKELADSETALVAAEARVAQGRREIAVLAAERARLDTRIADTAPVAPFTGTVVARHAEAGSWVGVGGPLVELVSSEALEAWLDVPQSWFAALVGAPGPLSLVVDATGEEVSAPAWRILPDVAPQGRSFPVIVPLPAGPALAPGMSVTARVPTGKVAMHTTVARDAVLLGETGAYVYLAKPTGADSPPVATRIPVEVLFRSGDRAAVRSPGLAAGDLVVVEGNERLYPTAPLAPRTAGNEEGGQPR